jgi:hypothetical protein
VVRLLRGIPITLGVAAAFLVVFVTVPVRRLHSIAHRRVDVHVPLVTDAQGYELVADQVATTLRANGMDVTLVTPPWWVAAPGQILLRLGGPSFHDYVPARLACFRGPRLDVVLYPNALTVTGSSQDTAWAHGLVVEALTAAPAYQTFDPDAQDIERQIRSVWTVFRQNPPAHVNAPRLRARLEEIARDIRELPVDYDEWQIVYRQALQLDRALGGAPHLLAAQAGPRESERSEEEAHVMAQQTDNDWIRALSTRELVREITRKATLLARKEIDLAKTEIKADLQSELATAKGLGIAAVVALLGLNGLFVALILALGRVMPGWLAALLVAGVFLAGGGIIGYASWTRRVTSPLARTRRMLRETAQWAKERLA